MAYFGTRVGSEGVREGIFGTADPEAGEEAEPRGGRRGGPSRVSRVTVPGIASTSTSASRWETLGIVLQIPLMAVASVAFRVVRFVDPIQDEEYEEYEE